MKHLFLTGRKQVGKSTLLNKVMEACGLDVTGFRTCPIYIGEAKRGYSMHAFCDVPDWMNDFIICARVGEQRIVAVPDAFDRNGTALLQACRRENKRWFLMDEIGKAENKSPAYCHEILDILDSDIHVLGILQDCRSELVAQIKAREDVWLITVDEENRDTLLPDIVKWVGAQA
ncbi:MAG: nucleoside-triphosphatase [Clostridia bacterium]|nr:nucleoside-triphosphatase [Clostridia bacterium]